MKRTFQVLLLGLFSLSFLVAYAQENEQAAGTPQAQVKKPKIKPLGEKKYKRFWRFCPVADALIYNNQSWGARGNWETMGLSFASEITAFEGVHWTGVNLGTVACLYKGSGVTFPVAIGRKEIVLKPEGRYWKKDDADGTSWSCVRSDPKDCPFVFHDEVSGSAKDMSTIYQEIQSLKPGAS